MASSKEKCTVWSSSYSLSINQNAFQKLDKGMSFWLAVLSSTCHPSLQRSGYVVIDFSCTSSLNAAHLGSLTALFHFQSSLFFMLPT